MPPVTLPFSEGAASAADDLHALDVLRIDGQVQQVVGFVGCVLVIPSTHSATCSKETAADAEVGLGAPGPRWRASMPGTVSSSPSREGWAALVMTSGSRVTRLRVVEAASVSLVVWITASGMDKVALARGGGECASRSRARETGSSCGSIVTARLRRPAGRAGPRAQQGRDVLHGRFHGSGPAGLPRRHCR